MTFPNLYDSSHIPRFLAVAVIFLTLDRSGFGAQ
jgi:hypothetical protein